MSGKREVEECNDGIAEESKRRVKVRSEASNATKEKKEDSQAKAEKNVAVKAKRKQAKSKANGFSFPERLMQIMEHREYWDAIRWSSDGCSFGINPEPFTEKVIDTHFQGGLFESMQKRLSRWGFQRVQMHVEFTGRWIAYHHVLFRRGKPALFHNLSSAEMLDVMTKAKAASSVPIKKSPPSQSPARKAERQNMMTVTDFQAQCTSPFLTPSNNSSSLHHPLSMNFAQSQNLSRLTANDLSLFPQDALHANNHLRPELLALQHRQLLSYLQRVANPTILTAPSSDPAEALARLQPATRRPTEQEKLFSLLSTNNRFDFLDELRVASLTDEQLLMLYLQSRQP